MSTLGERQAAERPRSRAARPPGEEPSARAAHWTWRLLRRIHLGTREPGNWVQLFKFGLVGGSGYVINLIVFAALTQSLGLHHIVAAIGAFCVAVSSNFLLNRAWTFGAKDGHAGFQAARFFAVSLIGPRRQPRDPAAARRRRGARRPAGAGDRGCALDAGELRRQQAVDLR